MFFSFEDGKEGSFAVLGLANAVVVFVGVRMNRPRHPLVWYFLAGSYLAAAAGNAADATPVAASGPFPLPSPADALYLVGYTLLVAAALLLVRRRAPWGDWASLVDAAIIATGAFMLSWSFLISPRIQEFGLPFAERLFLAAYPLLDVLLLAVVVRLMFTLGPRPAAYWMLVLGLAAALVSDTLYSATVLAGTYETGSLLEAGWLAAYFLGGAAALHPSMGAVAEPATRRRVGHDWRRLAALTAATLLGPAILAFGDATSSRLDAAVILGGTVVVLLLAAFRVADILRALETALEERQLSEAALRRSEQRLRAIVGNVPIVLFALDHRGVFTVSEGKGLEALGFEPGQSIGCSVFDLYGQESDIPENIRRALAGEEVTATVELGGRVFETWYAPLRGSGDEPGGVIGVGTDVTERQQAEVALRESEARFRQLFGQSVDALIVHDVSGKLVECNAQACRSLGYTRDELLALRVENLTDDLLTEEERREREQAGGTLWQRAIARDPDTFATLLSADLRRKDGSSFPAEIRVGGVDYGGERMILASIRDVTERVALEEQLRYQALHDSLTGLPNRTLFARRLREAKEAAKRESRMVAVLFLDLDNFKVINDSLGHETGDRLLAAVARRLSDRCIGPEDVSARLGGDEFVILLSDVDSLTEAESSADNIIEALREPFRLDGVGREIYVSTSVGVTLSEYWKDEPEELLRRADLAMYKAKDTGKGRYAIYNPSLNIQARKRLGLESALSRATENGEIRLYYQPKVHLRTGALVGLEALLRWEHPERGLLTPEEFVPLAEETGLIVPLERRALREACEQALRWQEHPRMPAPTVNFNLSARQFQRPGLVKEVAEVLEKTGLEPGFLTLELTETTAMENLEWTISILKELKNLGVSLSIDDFGTGYSSLTHLKGFPVDEIKIDRSTTEGVEKDPGDRAIVAATIMLARALNLEIVAEGVESAEQAQQLLSLGCDMGQGYYWLGPSPLEIIDEFLELSPDHRVG
ncbi:MAG: putative bifunctional diguanylate cyclase/phosphodiesterase [Rubrobacteraceae bacterium]